MNAPFFAGLRYWSPFVLVLMFVVAGLSGCKCCPRTSDATDTRPARIEPIASTMQKMPFAPGPGVRERTNPNPPPPPGMRRVRFLSGTRSGQRGRVRVYQKINNQPSQVVLTSCASGSPQSQDMKFANFDVAATHIRFDVDINGDNTWSQGTWRLLSTGSTVGSIEAFITISDGGTGCSTRRVWEYIATYFTTSNGHYYCQNWNYD